MIVNEEFSMTADGEFEEITKGDISQAIEKKLGTTNFVVLQYTLEPLSERIGLLGDHSILYVSILEEDGGERKISFFVKYFPKFEAPARFAEGIGAFSKEMFVYELFEQYGDYGVDIINTVTPKCYLAKHNKYLLLDNLSEQGFIAFDKHKPLDYDCVLIVLQALAKLHASTIIYEEKKSSKLGEHYRLTDDYQTNLEESFFNDKENFVNAKGVEASIKCVVKEIDIFNFPHKLLSGKDFPEVAKEVCYKIYDLVKPSTRFRNVLCHGDLWATNFMLKYSIKDQPITGCKFIDFQCGRYVPPAQDVLSLLYLTTTREFRDKSMYEVIGMYYSYLEKHLKVAGYNINNIIPFAQFMESCEEQKLFAIVQTAIYFPLILINNDAVEAYFSDSELNEKALFEDRSYLVLAHMNKDEAYPVRLRESIQDLKEYCDFM